MKKKNYFLVLLGLLLTTAALAQPTFTEGNDPKPEGSFWELKKSLSDEFKGKKLDEKKWKNTVPNGWIGRPPGLFVKETVSMKGGKLCVTNFLLDEPKEIKGKIFTHACGHIESVNKATVGDYMECRMKANKTFLSSTFWLINKRNEGKDCDRRVTELDIQECVGVVNTSKPFAKNFDESMHSNTHSRQMVCEEIPKGSKGNNVATSGKVYDDFHVYGAWWKSENEILFYLDGVYQYTLNPVAPFDLDMYIKLVTETYDWNKAPEDGGMMGSWEERTTQYDWVRTWKLSDKKSKSKAKK
ncbi:family 16 glycosylhydrolase [Persicobacter sp. CCB-QB2]|uniref:family 16 glycosylhydrolase n=1 Tax=Persicobacter sp. CCB-QB2 TaxID=1561025 RepID=UPI0006A987D0|nr:family 16 glycosylhydrolase [Persicobacter sp. CCB-QB2]